MLAYLLKTPLRICRRVFRSRGRANLVLLFGIIGLAALQMAIVVACSRGDGSWMLTNGKGLSQHLAAWVILVTDPLLLLSGAVLYRQFLISMLTLPARGEVSRIEIKLLLRRWLPLIHARGKYQYIYFLCLVAGFLGWLLNVKHTIDPVSTYNHDVFDSAAHLPSFIAFKTALFLSWAIVYPSVGFLFLATAFSTWRILRCSERMSLIEPRMEHPDHCYGLRNIGTLNIAVLAPFLIVFSSIYAIIETHQTLYGAIIAPIVIVFVLFIWTSYIVIRPVYSLLGAARTKAYNNLVKRIDAEPPSPYLRLRLAVDRLIYSTATASPYSTGTKIVLVAMQGVSAMPLALSLLG
jgi:hypothetical protein